VGSAFGTCGQNCTATSRIVFVGDDDRYAEFRQLLAEAAGSISLGDPLVDDTELGPMISSESHERVTSWIDEAVSKGATILQPRSSAPENGYFVPATVLEGVSSDTKLGTSEIFGPVTQLIRPESR